jgi:chlorobactene glucosyltransferase
VILLIASGVTLLVLTLVARDAWRLAQLQGLRDDELPVARPAASLLIPARNEGTRIGRCLRGALAQRYARYEVLVVDDGSTDATASVLAQYAQRDRRLRVLTGRALPAGWAGKPNACQQAAEAARGEWLLFLDADTAPEPALLGAMLAHAERRRLDLLSVFPLLELGTFWERLIMPPFLLIIQAAFPIERLNDPEMDTGSALANGQCLLMRRSAYEAIGGHGAVRNEVLEDVRLAQAARAGGYRVGMATALRQLRVRMYTSLAEVVGGLTKNAVAGGRAAGRRTLWAGLRVNLLAFAPLWLLALGLWALAGGDAPGGWGALGLALVAAAATHGYWAVLARRAYRISAGYALLWPVGLLCYDLIALRAAWFVWSGRGIVWKGRAYAG